MSRLKARDLRTQMEVEVDLGDGETLLAKRFDMAMLVFEGRVPLTLLTAVQKMMEMPNASNLERLASLDEMEKQDIIAAMRRHAAMVAIDPKVSEEQTDDPSVVPAAYLSLAQLTSIWTATAVVPKVTAAQAASFRSEVGIDDVVAAPVGEDVPPTPEHMGVGVDLITG